MTCNLKVKSKVNESDQITTMTLKMTTPSLPPTMRAWQFSSTAGGIEKNLQINPSVPLPKRKPDQHLVQVLAAALNPVDYKPAELALVTRLFLAPGTPGLDFAGRIVLPASGSSLQPGQLVFGRASSNIIGGALAEYAIAAQQHITPLPESVSPIHGASVCIAGVSAYQTIVPYVKDGSSIFINGGSGGTGCYGIQIAKAKGCCVTTTCSTANVELCKSLGADEVIDYKTQNVLDALKASGRQYDHVVDNVGADFSLLWKCHEYTRPGAVCVGVGAEISFNSFFEVTKMRLLPGFLGGMKRKNVGFFMVPKAEELAKVGEWMARGEVKAVIDSQFPFEDVPDAFRRLKTGRTRGKIVIKVAE